MHRLGMKCDCMFTFCCTSKQLFDEEILFLTLIGVFSYSSGRSVKPS